jgi:hypothetical protein
MKKSYKIKYTVSIINKSKYKIGYGYNINIIMKLIIEELNKIIKKLQNIGMK